MSRGAVVWETPLGLQIDSERGIAQHEVDPLDGNGAYYYKLGCMRLLHLNISQDRLVQMGTEREREREGGRRGTKGGHEFVCIRLKTGMLLFAGDGYVNKTALYK